LPREISAFWVEEMDRSFYFVHLFKTTVFAILIVSTKLPVIILLIPTGKCSVSIAIIEYFLATIFWCSQCRFCKNMIEVPNDISCLIQT